MRRSGLYTRPQVEQLSDPQAAVAEILKQCPAKQLMVLYKVPAFKDAAEFLQHVAFRRGRLLPGGIGDSHSAARVVLHDWHNGKLGYYTQAPKRGDGSHEDAAVVDAWGEAFDAHKVGHWLYSLAGVCMGLCIQKVQSSWGIMAPRCQVHFSKEERAWCS